MEVITESLDPRRCRPVFPVFFMVVWLDDSMLNFSSISSWYSSEIRASWSDIFTGDWFVAAHSGYEADQP